MKMITRLSRMASLAEAEGWDAVTTRRLATEIESSQPVLYSHFKGKDAIMAAVAVQGFAELREAVRALAGDDNVETLTETFWSGLHGLLTLMRLIGRLWS
jgi:AcrR family transcriptional regulator